jgi:hypothetical protein
MAVCEGVRKPGQEPNEAERVSAAADQPPAEMI